MRFPIKVAGIALVAALGLAGCSSSSTAAGSSSAVSSTSAAVASSAAVAPPASSAPSSSASSSAAAVSSAPSSAAAVSSAPSSAAPVSSAGSGAPVAGKKISILWVQPLFTHPVHKIMQAGFKAACDQAGDSCTLVGNPSATNYDIPATITLAEAAMAKTKFDAIAVYDADPGIDSFIAKLGQGGYPVVTWHVLPAAGSVPGLKAAAAEDIPTAGANAARAIGAKINGTGTVAVTEGSSNTTENLMVKSFTDTMKSSYPNVKVLPAALEGFDPAAAQTKAVGIIQANPDVVAAFSTTGGGPATWAGAQRVAGKKLTIIGMDYTRQNLDLVKSGDVYGVVAQPLYAEAQKVVELAGAVVNKQPVQYLNTLPSPVITNGQLQPYYDILTRAGD
jgi:ribose transport system substrate-binding protein